MQYQGIDLCSLDMWVEVQRAITRDNDILKFQQLSSEMFRAVVNGIKVIEKIEIGSILVATVDQPLIHGGYASRAGQRFKVVEIDGDMIDMEPVDKAVEYTIVGIDQSEIISGYYYLELD